MPNATISKQALFSCACLLVAASLVGFWWSRQPPAYQARPRPETPEAALAELKAGNARYALSQRTVSTATHVDAAIRADLASGQHPFTAVICCADSRLSPEFIFDQQIGAIFEIRNAGNVVD